MPFNRMSVIMYGILPPNEKKMKRMVPIPPEYL